MDENVTNLDSPDKITPMKRSRIDEQDDHTPISKMMSP